MLSLLTDSWSRESIIAAAKKNWRAWSTVEWSWGCGNRSLGRTEAHGQCTVLDSKLGESHFAFSDILKLVQELEYT